MAIHKMTVDDIILIVYQGAYRRRTTMKPKLIQFSDEHGAIIQAAADRLGITFTAFVRMAALNQARDT
tara:strand:+ start:775 stop:978 length:204 start_codon:yes stop_codon:yes gene_type:complete